MMVKWFGAAKQSKEKQVSHLEMHFRVGKLLQQSILHLLRSVFKLFKLGRINMWKSLRPLFVLSGHCGVFKGPKRAVLGPNKDPLGLEVCEKVLYQ